MGRNLKMYFGCPSCTFCLLRQFYHSSGMYFLWNRRCFLRNLRWPVEPFSTAVYPSGIVDGNEQNSPDDYRFFHVCSLSIRWWNVTIIGRVVEEWNVVCTIRTRFEDNKMKGYQVYHVLCLNIPLKSVILVLIRFLLLNFWMVSSISSWFKCFIRLINICWT